MSRSLKKGPFVANHLLKVQKLNDQDEKKLSKLGHDHHNCPNYDWSYNCSP
jgi:ribosomal protein S19